MCGGIFGKDYIFFKPGTVIFFSFLFFLLALGLLVFGKYFFVHRSHTLLFLLSYCI